MTRYEYGPTGNLLREVPPPGALKPTSYVYDALGRQVGLTDGNGRARNVQYDALGRRTTVQYNTASACSEVTCDTYAFDRDGNAISRIGNGTTTRNTFDALGRLLAQETTGSGASASTRMSYDLSNNMLTYTDATGTITYGYDAEGQLVSLAEQGGSCSGTIVRCTTFEYNEDGVRTRTIYPGGTVIEYRNIDGAGRALDYYARAGNGATVMDFGYNYLAPDGSTDRLQSRADRLVVGTATETYSYDAVGRLADAVERVGPTISTAWHYCYDATGNRTLSSVDAAATSLCPGQAGGPAATYNYDATDALISSGGSSPGTYTYDGNGAELSGPIAGVSARTQATWNPRGQLASVNVSGAMHEFAYAGWGNQERTRSGSSTFTNTPLGVSGVTGSSAVGVVREPDGSLIALQSGGTSSYFVADQQGSTIALVSADGVPQNSYRYDPYGGARSKSEAVANPWQYVGGYLDTTGMYYFSARYYDPVLGRFTQRDPSGMDDHYTYAGNNPIGFADPSGLHLITVPSYYRGDYCTWSPNSYGFGSVPFYGPCALHDICYRYGYGVSRLGCDNNFLWALKHNCSYKLSAWWQGLANLDCHRASYSYYYAVRAAGWVGFHR